MYSLAGKPLLYPFLQVLLVIDWAMKWIQTKYRQSQSEFFGLKGLPWHVTHVVRVKPSSTTSSGLTKKVFENRTFCHVFNNSLQNGATVISILEDVLKRIKLDHPEIRTAFIRCDNAGCYHGSETLLSLKMLFDSTGIFIRRIDFSEPQAGKNGMHLIERKNVERKKISKMLLMQLQHIPALRESYVVASVRCTYT
jgi:hypothetical protein